MEREKELIELKARVQKDLKYVNIVIGLLCVFLATTVFVTYITTGARALWFTVISIISIINYFRIVKSKKAYEKILEEIEEMERGFVDD